MPPNVVGLWSLLSAVILAACQSSAKPLTSEPAYLRSSGIDREALSVELWADKTTVSPGDTVRFVMVARNAGNDRIQVGVQCGPAMDVRMRGPSGQSVSVLHAQFENAPIRVIFTCELGAHHFAEARDSLIDRLWWTAPRERGQYIAVAGGRGDEGLDDLSAPISIRVF
jgi:hypothetical protein